MKNISDEILIQCYIMILVAFLPLIATKDNLDSGKRFEVYGIICYSLSDMINFTGKQVQAYVDSNSGAISESRFIETRDDLWKAQLGQHSREYVEALGKEYFPENSEMVQGIEKIYDETEEIMSIAGNTNEDILKARIDALWNTYKIVVSSYKKEKHYLLFKYFFIVAVAVISLLLLNTEKTMKYRQIVIVGVSIVFAALLLAGCDPNCGKIPIPVSPTSNSTMQNNRSK